MENRTVDRMNRSKPTWSGIYEESESLQALREMSDYLKQQFDDARVEGRALDAAQFAGRFSDVQQGIKALDKAHGSPLLHSARSRDQAAKVSTRRQERDLVR